MAIDFNFYDSTDTTLTTPLGSSLTFVGSADAGAAAITKHFLYGSPTASTQLQMASNPGVDQIPVALTDSGSGSGHAITEVKLASTEGGLTSATAGASLNIGHTILSGAANAVHVWIEYNPPHPRTVERNTEIGLTVGATSTALLQSPV